MIVLTDRQKMQIVVLSTPIAAVAAMSAAYSTYCVFTVGVDATVPIMIGLIKIIAITGIACAALAGGIIVFRP